MLRKLQDLFSSPDRLEEDDNRIHVATCAIFTEMALIDGEFSADERNSIVEIMCQRYGVEAEYAEDLLAEARAEVERNIDHWRLSKIIRENFSKADQIRIVEDLWRIVFVDGHMDHHELYLVNKIGDLLHISHQEFVDAKQRVLREQANNAK